MNVGLQNRRVESCEKHIILYCSGMWSMDFPIEGNSNLKDKYLSLPQVKLKENK